MATTNLNEVIRTRRAADEQKSGSRSLAPKGVSPHAHSKRLVRQIPSPGAER
jgi:hypothetical protein